MVAIEMDDLATHRQPHPGGDLDHHPAGLLRRHCFQAADHAGRERLPQCRQMACPARLFQP